MKREKPKARERKMAFLGAQIAAEDLERLQAEADQQTVSVSALVRLFVREGLERRAAR